MSVCTCVSVLSNRWESEEQKFLKFFSGQLNLDILIVGATNDISSIGECSKKLKLYVQKILILRIIEDTFDHDS